MPWLDSVRELWERAIDGGVEHVGDRSIGETRVT
jgi:hypothetical protein